MNNKITIIGSSSSFMYLSNTKAIGYEFAENWIFFWTFYIPVAMVLEIFSKNNYLIIKGSLLIIPIFIMTIARRYIKSALVFLFTLLILSLFIYFISFSLIEKILFSLMMLVSVINTVQKRREEVYNFYNISIVILPETFIGICFVISTFLNSYLMQSLITFAAINIIITAIIYLHLCKTGKLMEWEKEYANKFSERVRQLKILFALLIGGFVVFVLWLVWATGLLDFLDVMQSKLIALFSFKAPPPLKQVAQAPKANQQSNDMGEMLKNLGVKENTSNIAAIVLKIIEIALSIIIVIFLLFLIWSIVKKIQEFFLSLKYKKEDKKEQREFVLTLEDIARGVRARTDGFKLNFKLPFKHSNEKKIRDIYCKIIRRNSTKDFKVADTYTPMEIGEKIRIENREDIGEATVLYEKARYSNIACTKEDVEKIKRML